MSTRQVKTIIFIVIIVAFAGLSFSSTPDQFPVYDVTNLGTTLGATSSFAYALNNNGWVVGSSGGGFLWKDGVMTDLGTLYNQNCLPEGINDFGQIVGRVANTAFLWDPQVTEPNGFVPMQDLGRLPGGWSSDAYDINNHKQIVGSSTAGGTNYNHAVLWQNEQIIDLGGFGKGSIAYAINDNGQIVGRAEVASGQWHATLFDPNGTGNNLDLGTLGGSYSSAYDINNNGQVVGYSTTADGKAHPFLWENGTMTDLGTFGYPQSQALSINDNGQIVGLVHEPPRAFLWNSATGSTDPNDPDNGFILLDELCDVNLPSSEFDHFEIGYDISNNGQIAGRGDIHDGPGVDYRAFLMVPQSIVKYTLTVSTEPNAVNTVVPSVGQHQYYEHSMIDISAQPFTDCPNVYYFTEWQGDVMAPTLPNTNILIDGDKTVRALFEMGERVCGDLCHPILQGDLNGDCYINMADFTIYMESWLACTHPDCDYLHSP